MIMPQQSLILWMLLTLVLATAPQAHGADSAPADQKPKSIEELKSDAQNRIDLQWKSFPSLGEQLATSVVRFHFDHDRLLVQSDVPADTGPHRVQLKGLPAMAIVRFTQSRTPGVGFLLFEYYDFSRPAMIDVHEEVISSPVTLQIAQDVEFGDSTQSVTFIQYLMPSGDNGVSLHVQAASEIDGHPITNLSLSAATFAALRKEHPAEVEQYLRPVFRDLDQEHLVFGVDDKAAWQIVSDTWKTPADLPKRVNDVIAGLDADNYDDRNAAAKTLSAMGEPAALYLMSMNRGALSGEQAARVNSFLRSYHPLTDEQAKSMRTDVNFLLDCLDTSDPVLASAVLDHLNKAAGREVSFDPHLQGAERATAIAKLRRQLAPSPTTAPSTQATP